MRGEELEGKAEAVDWRQEQAGSILNKDER